MAIVLAIEPDRRQAAHLTAIMRQQVDAELVIADTTEGALDAIGNRVPDLVLVPALLSPQDDAALAAALRVIAAAAHVRTLTIPVLASGVKRAPASGMLAKWRKNRAASQEPEGCDPAVFGEQISAYLQEAAAERAQLEEDALLNEKRIPIDLPSPSLDIELRSETPAPARSAEAEVVAAGFIHQPWDEMEPVDLLAADPVEELVADSVAELATHPIEALAADPVAELASYPIEALAADPVVELASYPIEELAAAPVEQLAAEPLEDLDVEPSDDPMIDLSDELEGLSTPMNAEALDDEAIGVYTITTDTELSVFDAFDEIPGILEPPSIIEDVEAALDQIAAAARVQSEPVPFARRRSKPARVEPVVAQPLVIAAAAPPRPDITPWEPMYLTPGRIWPALEGVPAETPAAHTEQPDWIELVASLRQDLERRRTDPSLAAADPIAARPSDGADAKVHRAAKRPRAHVRKAKPVQDEWGFFDPERCGFSTLLAKLEEITEDDVRPLV